MQAIKLGQEIKRIHGMRRNQRRGVVCEVCRTQCNHVKQGGYFRKKKKGQKTGAAEKERVQRYKCKKMLNRTFTYIAENQIPYSQYEQPFLIYLVKSESHQLDHEKIYSDLERSTLRRLKRLLCQTKEKVQTASGKLFGTIIEAITYIENHKKKSITRWFYEQTGRALFGVLSQHRLSYN